MAATATSVTNKENQGGYGRKHKLMHDGYSFNLNNDGNKSVQYNCINNCVKHPVCSAHIKILKIDGSIFEKVEHRNLCAQKIRNGNPLKYVTNANFTQEMMGRVDELAI